MKINWNCPYRLNCRNFGHCDRCNKNYSNFKAWFNDLPKPSKKHLSWEVKEGLRKEKIVANMENGKRIIGSGKFWWEKGDVKTDEYLIQVKTTTDDKLRIYFKDVFKEIEQARKVQKKWKRIMFVRDFVFEMEITDEKGKEVKKESYLLKKDLIEEVITWKGTSFVIRRRIL